MQEGRPLSVKLGSTQIREGDANADRAALRRIGEQVGTANPEQPQMLLALEIPDLLIERLVHAHLRSRGLWVEDAPGREWFRFPSRRDLDELLDRLREAALCGDFSNFGRIEEVLATTGTREAAWEALREAEGILCFCSGPNAPQIPPYFAVPFMEELGTLYPGFREWLLRTRQNPGTTFLVSLDADGRWSGILIWKRKGQNDAKLACWWVAPWDRGRGTGSLLMAKALHQWEMAGFNRVFVTARRREVVNALGRHGFLWEGYGRDEYGPGEGEHHMSRLLLHGTFSPEAADARLFPEDAPIQKRPDGPSEWDRLSYPAILDYPEPGRGWGVIIPIQPPYLQRLLSNRKSVYFGSVQRHVEPGERTYLYATSPLSAVVGEARIGRVERGPAMEVWQPNQALGVLSLSEFTARYREPSKHVQLTQLYGLSLYDEPLPLNELVECEAIAAHPQRTQSIAPWQVARLHEVKRRHG